MVDQLLQYLSSLNDCNPPPNSSLPLQAMSQPGTYLTPLQPITCTLHQENSTLSLSSQLNFIIPSIASSTNVIPAPSDTDSQHSVHSRQSTRQLCLRLPITYNVAALMKLDGRPQIRMLNSICIPLPIDDSDQEKSPMTSDSDHTVEETPTMSDSNCTMEESPMTSDSEDTVAESPMKPSSKMMERSHQWPNHQLVKLEWNPDQVKEHT